MSCSYSKDRTRKETSEVQSTPCKKTVLPLVTPAAGIHIPCDLSHQGVPEQGTGLLLTLCSCIKLAGVGALCPNGDTDSGHPKFHVLV